MTAIVSASLNSVNSALRIPADSTLLKNIRVQKIDEIYRGRLRILIKEAGSQTALAEKLGKQPAQISQWLNASIDPKSGKPRSMSRGIARQLELDCKKPEGWMDQPLEETEQPQVNDAPMSVPLQTSWSREALECASMVDRLKLQSDRERVVAMVIHAVLDRMPRGRRGLGPSDVAASPQTTPPTRPPRSAGPSRKSRA